MPHLLDSSLLAGAPNGARLVLRAGVSTLALSIFALAAPGLAQTAPAPAPAKNAAPAVAEPVAASPEDIVVTGFRASLLSAQAIKKNSNTIVDSVSADDIGALPDRSVTETLQRIPGISINRFAAGVDPDHFSAEGSGVVVRGLTYVRSEFNGRDAFTANNGRGLGFADVPSELLGGVDVYKSLPADRIEGGIAGTVNLKTRKPFNAPDTYIAASIENSYSDFAQRSAPTAALVASKRFDTAAGEFGILGSVSYSKLFSRSDRIAISHFKNRPLAGTGSTLRIAQGADPITGYGLVPSGAVQGTQDFERERIGVSGALQWRSNDGNIEAVVEYIRSDARQSWTERTVEVTTDNVDNNGGVLSVPGTALTFDPSGVFTSGLITGNTGWRNDQFSGAARTPVRGLQSNNIRRDNENTNVSQDISANLIWKATDRLTASFDYQHVTSKVEVDDNTLWTSSYQDASIKVNGNDLPEISFLPPTNCKPDCNGALGSQNNPAYFSPPNANFLSPFNSFYRASMDHTERSDGYSNAVRIDLDYAFPDSSFVTSVKGGYRFADRNQTARFSTYNWGVLSEQWGGNPGPVWLDTPIASNGNQPLNGTGGFVFQNFFGGAVASPSAPGRPFFTGNTVKDYDAYVAYALAVAKQWGNSGTWVPLASRPGVIAGTPFLPGEVNPANERNNAAYVMLNYASDFSNGMRLSGNVGLRYTSTKRTSEGGSFVASGGNTFGIREETCKVPAGNPDPFCLLAPDVRAALVASDTGGAAAYTPSTAKLTYDFFLPSFNARLEVGNGLQFRAAYFKGVAPPDFGLTRNYSRIDGIEVKVNPATPTQPFLTGSVISGNPFLLPTTSDNFDITAEYYFGDGNQLTIAGFYKILHNVVTNDTFSSTVPVGSADATIIGYQPVNSSETGKVKGIELSYLQTYRGLPGLLAGLGLQANYTFVASDGVTQSVLSATDPNVAAGNVSNIPGDEFPLQGLSKHTFNIVPFYEMGPITVRAAYTWRSEFLLTLRDVITPYDPIFQRAYGQLDGSISFNVNKNFQLGVQGVNLLNSLVETSAAVLDNDGEIVIVPRAWYKTDRRFTISARFNF